MFVLGTSRFYEKRNANNKIALNLFQGDIDDYNENDQYEEILTKRGKMKNKSKIEYFKNYINNFKEIKFQTARPIEIFRKKEDKKQKEMEEENINIIKDNIQKNLDINNNNKFNLIKEKFQEERREQIENLNDNDISNEKNSQFTDKVKKTKKEISDKILKNNEVMLNKIKKNKNMAKIVEKEKEKIKKKKMKLKEKENPKNLSTGKALELLDKDNGKFLKLIKAKKIRKTIKRQLNKSFNNFYNKEKYFLNEVEIELFSPITKTNSNENTKRKMKNIRNKLHMKIIYPNDKFINTILEKEMFNKKRKNSIKASTYLSKSCSSKKDKYKSNLENNKNEITKISKNPKQCIKKKINNNISDNQNK